MKLTEQVQFLSYEQRELTLSKMLVAAKPNELVNISEMPLEQEQQLEFQEDLGLALNFNLQQISINHKANIRQQL